MGKLLNLVGLKFHRLTVIERNGSSPSKKALWKVKCDCGNVIDKVLGVNLTKGNTKSCGCYKIDRAAEAATDLTGMKFGRWVVLKFAGNNAMGARTWDVKCECGSTRNATL